MKKWIRRGAALCAAVLLAVTGTIGCLAAVTEKETTVVVEEMDLEVTVPAGYHVLTPDMSENDGAFLLAGITDPAGKLQEYRDNGIYLHLLSEETGLTAGRLQYLGANFTSPGYSEEVLHIYLALGLHAGDCHPDQDEFLIVEKYRLSELSKMVMDGEIDDGKTIVAVLKAEKYLSGR